MPLNSADDPLRCTFTLPAVLRRGDLQITVSTNGRSPAYAKWIKARIDEMLAAHTESLLELLGEARDAIEDIVEPYLMQQGFVQRTPRGRVLASAAYGHLGLKPPATPAQTGLFADDSE